MASEELTLSVFQELRINRLFASPAEKDAIKSSALRFLRLACSNRLLQDLAMKQHRRVQDLADNIMELLDYDFRDFMTIEGDMESQVSLRVNEYITYAASIANDEGGLAVASGLDSGVVPPSMYDTSKKAVGVTPTENDRPVFEPEAKRLKIASSVKCAECNGAGTVNGVLCGCKSRSIFYGDEDGTHEDGSPSLLSVDAQPSAPTDAMPKHELSKFVCGACDTPIHEGTVQIVGGVVMICASCFARNQEAGLDLHHASDQPRIEEPGKAVAMPQVPPNDNRAEFAHAGSGTVDSPLRVDVDDPTNGTGDEVASDNSFDNDKSGCLLCGNDGTPCDACRAKAKSAKDDRDQASMTPKDLFNVKKTGGPPIGPPCHLDVSFSEAVPHYGRLPVSSRMKAALASITDKQQLRQIVLHTVDESTLALYIHMQGWDVGAAFDTLHHELPWRARKKEPDHRMLYEKCVVILLWGCQGNGQVRGCASCNNTMTHLAWAYKYQCPVGRSLNLCYQFDHMELFGKAENNTLDLFGSSICTERRMFLFFGREMHPRCGPAHSMVTIIDGDYRTMEQVKDESPLKLEEWKKKHVGDNVSTPKDILEKSIWMVELFSTYELDEYPNCWFRNYEAHPTRPDDIIYYTRLLRDLRLELTHIKLRPGSPQFYLCGMLKYYEANFGQGDMTGKKLRKGDKRYELGWNDIYPQYIIPETRWKDRWLESGLQNLFQGGVSFESKAVQEAGEEWVANLMDKQWKLGGWRTNAVKDFIKRRDGSDDK